MLAGEVTLQELAANGTNYFSWLAPDSITNTIRYKFPDISPTAGQVPTMSAPTGSISQITFANKITTPGGNGLIAHTGSDASSARSITGTANEITVTNGDGVSGNPTLSLSPTFDVSGKTSTKPAKTGTVAPGTCNVGELFYNTDATAGQNLYGCTAPNTWTLQGDGGGGGGGGGDNASVNGTAATDADFDNATPAAPVLPTSGEPGINVRWQKDSSSPNNISAYLPFRQMDPAGNIAVAYLREEFMSGATGGAGSIGGIGFYQFLSGTGSSGSQASEAGRPGLWRLATGASSGTANIMLYPGGNNLSLVIPADNWDMLTMVRPVTCDADFAIRIGLANHATLDQPNDGIYIEKAHSDNSFYLVTRSAGAQSKTSTAVGTCSANAWHKLRLRRKDSTSIAASLNGGAEVCITSSAYGCDVNSSSSITSTMMTPRISISNNAANNRVLDIDYFDIAIATSR
jgi:hypothetical protein